MKDKGFGYLLGYIIGAIIEIAFASVIFAFALKCMACCFELPFHGKDAVLAGACIFVYRLLFGGSKK